MKYLCTFVLAVACVIFPSVSYSQISDEDCLKVLKIHAFLSRGQFQCKFNKYDQGLIDSASYCKQRLKLEDQELRNLLEENMKLFDELSDKLGGLEKACQSILSGYSGLIAK